jgi:HD domain
MRRARYRLGQFLSHLRPQHLGPDERAEVESVLGAGLAQLFRRQTAGEQAHSLRVMRAVAASGGEYGSRRELLQAALLHDVGKSAAPINLTDRALVVLARRFAPDAARRWGTGRAVGLRRPFVTALRHADWGADLCARAGALPVTVDLVRRHQTPMSTPATPEDEMLALLQAADDDN